MSDFLTRVFGPEEVDDKFRPLNESKIIPFHDCEYTERQTWTWTGYAMAQLCTVCGQPPPPIVEEI